MTLTHSTQRKHAFVVNTKESKNHKSKFLKIYIFELLNQRLGHRSKRSLLDVDTENVWQNIELRVDPDPFCTSFQISIINKKARSSKPLKSKTSFKWVFMDIIPAKSSKISEKDTTFAN